MMTFKKTPAFWKVYYHAERYNAAAKHKNIFRDDNLGIFFLLGIESAKNKGQVCQLCTSDSFASAREIAAYKAGYAFGGSLMCDKKDTSYCFDQYSEYANLAEEYTRYKNNKDKPDSNPGQDPGPFIGGNDCDCPNCRGY